MAVIEVYEALGSFEFELLGNVPREVLDTIDYFGHVAIIPGRLDPRQYGDGCLDAARYVGVVRAKKLADDGRTNLIQDDIRISGIGMNFWLGDEEGNGPVIENNTEFVSAGFSTVINTLRPTSVSAGTTHTVTGAYTGRHQYETARSAIQYVCQTLSQPSDAVTFRVNNDGSLDAGYVSDMYVTNPTCVIVRRNSTTQGEDMFSRALPSTVDLDQDMERFTTRVVMIAEADNEQLATGSADIATVAPGVNVYKDLLGNDLAITRLVSESETTVELADTRAELALRETIEPNRAFTIASDDYDIHGSFVVGDFIYIYDPDAGLVDTDNEIYVRGVRLNPVKLQVTETDWPITRGYTVAYRDKNGTWTDLTDYVHWEETQPSQIVIGSLVRDLTEASNAARDRAFDYIPQAGSDGSTPDQVTLNTPFVSSSYEDNTGNLKSLVVVDWDIPLNTDTSAITDGNLYEISFKPATETAWETRTVGWGTNTLLIQGLLPNVSYNFRVRAVDVNANQGAWSSTQTQTTSSTPSVPAAPAAPSVSSDSAEDSTGVLKSFAQVTWVQPLNTDASPIVDGQSYEVQYKLNTASNWASQMVPFGTVTTQITNLNPAALYNFKVRASDNAGNVGAFSSATNHTTAASASTPGAVTISSVNSDASEDTAGVLRATAVVNWSTPTNTDASSIIDGNYYEVQNKTSAATAWESRTVAFGTNSSAIPNLLTNAAYNFRVRCVDQSGRVGAFGSTSNHTTAGSASVPAAPTMTPSGFATSSYEVAGATRSRILATWSTPLNTNATTVIDGGYYELQFKVDGQSNWETRTVAWGTNEILISDLVPNIAYRFRIRAVDNNGNASAYSSEGTRTTGNTPTVPNAPVVTASSLNTASYADTNGVAKAYQIVTWTVPTNSDASAITDGSHYELNLQRNGDAEWSSYNVAWGTNSFRFNDLSVGTVYKVRIRTVDRGGNMSSFSSTVTFTTAEDTVAPSTPAAPTVAASMVAVQITHSLGVSGGGSFNLEPDLAKLEVHKGTTSTFTPDTTTRIGYMTATSAELQAGTPVVKTFDVSDTANRWYKVRAIDHSGNASNYSSSASATATLIDDAHISDLTVSKVTAGTVSANWLLGASIRTAASGSRVELNTSGLQAFDSGGNQTVNLTTSGAFTLESPPSAASTPIVEFAGTSGIWSDSVAGTNFSLPKPSGVKIGDLMVAFLATSGEGTTVTTPPTGWTLVATSKGNVAGAGQDTNLVIMKKTYALGDPVVWDDGVTTTAPERQSVVLGYTGADVASNQFGPSASTNSATAASALNTGTATNDNASNWRICAWAGQDTVTGGTWSTNENAERIVTSEVGSGSNWLTMIAADSNGTVAATNSPRTGTFTAGSSTNWVSAAAWVGHIEPLPTSSARLEIDVNGIRAYDQVDTKTLDIAAATGSIDLQGSVTSLNYTEGLEGWRIGENGSVQFSDLGVLGTVGASDGYFTNLFMNGIAVPSQDTLNAHYQVPFPSLRVHATGDGTLVLDGTLKLINLSYKEHERNTSNGSMWASGAPSRVIAPVTGMYQVSYNFVWQNGTSGSIADQTGTVTSVRVHKNAGGVAANGDQVDYNLVVSGGNNFTTNNGTFTMFLEAGDYLEFFALRGTSATVNNGASSAFGIGDGKAYVDMTMVASATGEGADSGSIQRMTGGASAGDGSNAVFTSSFTATDNTSWTSSNNIRPNEKRIFQGHFDGTYGNQKSLIKFDYAAIVSALSGKTVTGVTLTFKVRHAYESGSFDVIIGTHNQTSIGAWSGPMDVDRVRKYNTTIGATYSVELGSVIANEFKNGTSKGIVIGPGPTTSSINYYGYLAGYNQTGPPKLTFTYTA